MNSIATTFAVAYIAVGVGMMLLARNRLDFENSPEPDWVAVAFGWPVLLGVIVLMLLIGVVIPMWDEVVR